MSDSSFDRGVEPQGIPRQVGFVGLGAMGKPMAGNLLAAGHQLTVHDVQPAAADELVGAGAVRANSAREVAAASDVTFLSLPQPSDVEAVMTGPDGILAGAARGHVVFDLSTNSPSVVVQLARLAADRGVTLLDAPVSGGVAGARKGTLAVMVGGDRDAFEAHRELLQALGDRLFHVGDTGAGNTVKLINNLLFLIGVLGTVEGLAMGAKAGVDLNVLRDVVQAGSGASFVWDYATRAILKDRLAPNFTVALAAKDISLATALADDLDVPVPMGDEARELLVGYRDSGFAADDVLGIIKAVEERAGVQVRGRSTP